MCPCLAQTFVLLLCPPTLQLRASTAENAKEWRGVMHGVIEQIDQQAAGAEAGEVLKAARMLVYEEQQLEWVACRLTLTATSARWSAVMALVSDS